MHTQIQLKLFAGGNVMAAAACRDDPLTKLLAEKGLYIYRVAERGTSQGAEKTSSLVYGSRESIALRYPVAEWSVEEHSQQNRLLFLAFISPEEAERSQRIGQFHKKLGFAISTTTDPQLLQVKIQQIRAEFPDCQI